MPPQYPQNADGQLRNGQEFGTKLQGKLKQTLFEMCTKNPPEAGKPSFTDTKANLIFKRVFCNFLFVVGTNVGCGLVEFSFFITPGFLPRAAALMFAMAL